MKAIKKLLFPFLVLALWTFFVLYGYMGSGFLLTTEVEGSEPEDFMEYARKKMNETFIGNLAIAILENGEIQKEYYYSVNEPVNDSTLFKMASVTKWVTAWGVLELVEEGLIDLDSPIESYLVSWELPPSEFDHSAVTTRRILTHTAGINDEYEFNHHTHPDSVESIYEYLSLTEVVYPPGSDYYYSNNGYAILQVLIEDVTGMTFENYMKEKVLHPLGMMHSSFTWSDTLTSSLAVAYDKSGNITPHFYYPDQSTGTLYTSVTDISRFLKAHLSENAVLNSESMELMTQNQLGQGFPQQALGPEIYGKTPSGGYIIGHGGLERWTVENQVLLNPVTGDGLIAFCNGSMDFAHLLGDEWLF